MRKNNVALNLLPLATLTDAASQFRAIHVRPEPCNCHQHIAHHPLIQRLSAMGLPVPDFDTAQHPKFERDGGVTIGYIIDEAKNVVNVGFSKCRDDEPYSKKFGVNSVKARMLEFDAKFTFSIGLDNLTEFAVSRMEELKGLQPSFVDSIVFANLTQDAVEYAIGQGVALRLLQIKEAADAKLAEIKQEQQKRHAAKRHLKEVAKGDLTAAVLSAHDQTPPIQ